MLHDGLRAGGGLVSSLTTPLVTVRAAGLCNFVEERVAVEDTVCDQPAADERERPGRHVPFAHSLVTLTLLLLLKASPKHPLLGTVAFTSPLTT